MEKQDYKNRYINYSKEVQEHLSAIIDNTEMSPEYIVTLDILAQNIDLMFKMKKDIDENGTIVTNSRGNATKNYSLQLYTSAMQTVLKIINSFKTNPMSRAKIEKLNSTDDFEIDTLDEFLNPNK